MTEVSGKNFGFLIAYILPGFVRLWAISYFSPTVRAWLVSSSSAAGAATVGGFLYVTLASVGAGLAAPNALDRHPQRETRNSLRD
jgi:hypothetical protein